MTRELQVIKGSLAEVSKAAGRTLAEAFIGCDYVVVLDCSGSMSAKDSRGGKSRFVPGGVPPFIGASTNLAEALQFVKVADVGDISFIVISDGEPDSKEEALAAASTFQGQISTIFVGPEGERRGRDFLAQLAKCGQGRTVSSDRATDLLGKVQRLMLE